jgi:hypothetical protein
MSRVNKWKWEDLGQFVELTPVADVKEHLSGDECWCSPAKETINRVLIRHHLYDNCKSYNWAIGELEEVVLARPDWLPEGKRLNGVPVDNCIADVIELLWSNGVTTLGSCCGHGKKNPSIVLSEGQGNYEQIESLICELDSRRWELFQWQLVDVSVRDSVK